METPPSTVQSILDRLNDLERQNRRLKHGFVCLLVAAAAVSLVAARSTAKGKTVEAERFVVVDADGNKLAVLGFDKPIAAWEEPVPGLYLYNGDGSPQVLLNTDGNQGANLYFQEGDDTRLGIVTRKNKMGGLVVYRDGKDRKSEIGLFYSDDGKPGLFLNDAKGTTRFGAMLEKGGKPVLSLNDKDGKAIFLKSEQE